MKTIEKSRSAVTNTLSVTMQKEHLEKWEKKKKTRKFGISISGAHGLLPYASRYVSQNGVKWYLSNVTGPDKLKD